MPLTVAIWRRDRFVARQTVDRDIIKVGRDARSHIALIDDPNVSRMHAVIEVVHDEVTIIDLGSDSGTIVNGTRINKAKLAIGDRVQLGATTLVLEKSGPQQAREDAPLQLPTPEIVRAHVGDAFAPAEFFGVAALVLHVDGVRREAWSDDTELAVKRFESYPRGDVPAPEIGARASSFKMIDDTIRTASRRCTMCSVRPGYAPCALCTGTGAGGTTDVYDRCSTCDGTGFVPCDTCLGTQEVVACGIRYVNDTPVLIRRVIVPSIDPTLRPFVEARISDRAVWPDTYAFNPEPGLVATAYRGASTVRAQEDFHGFFFGDAIAAVLTVRDELTTGLARFDARTYAVPVLWAVTGSHHSAYFFDELGALQTVMAMG